MEATQIPKNAVLSDLSTGERGTVVLVQDCEPELRSKLLSMGLVSGREVEVIHFAPLGDPMTVQVLGSQIALRLNEAAKVLVSR